MTSVVERSGTATAAGSPRLPARQQRVQLEQHGAGYASCDTYCRWLHAAVAADEER